MASTSKAFKKCVDPCPRYLTPDDTHNCCIFCLGEEHARDVLEGAICVHCELFSMKKLCSRLSRRYLRVRKLRLNPLKPPALHTKSCWRLWNAPRRGLTCRGSEPRWRRRGNVSMSDTNSGHNTPAQVSLPFLPDLHTEVEKEWKKPFSSRIHRFQHTSYANIVGMRESGYERMPPIEETLASYLSMGETASLKVPSLPSKPLQDTSRINGRAYAAAGQAVASLHTMAVLQGVPGRSAERPG